MASTRPRGQAKFPRANPRQPPHSPLSPPHPLAARPLSPAPLGLVSRALQTPELIADAPPRSQKSPSHASASRAPRRTRGRSSNGRAHDLRRLRRQAAPGARVPGGGAPLRVLLRGVARRKRPLAGRVRQDLLRRARAVLGAALVGGHLPRPRGGRHLRPDPLQGVQGVRQAREAVDQEAPVVAQQVRAGLGAGARHPGHHRENQAPVRQLRQVRPALRLRWPAAPHRQRRPAALGRVHHPGPALPLHRRLDRVGRQELPHRHPRREEARHEGDHHRRRARLAAHPQGVHLARRSLPRADQRRPRRQGLRHRLLLSDRAGLRMHGCLVTPRSVGLVVCVCVWVWWRS